MRPQNVSLAAAALVVALAGCNMCQGPFDYCNPAIQPGGCLNCDWGARRGSAFHPFHEDPVVGTTSPAPERIPGTQGGSVVADSGIDEAFEPASAEMYDPLDDEDVIVQ